MLKKIVLLIVEGTTDRDSLAYIIDEILGSNNLVEFQVVGGDITSDYKVRTDNILKKITSLIKNNGARKYKSSDYKEIIHIVDIDGTYLNDSYIKESQDIIDTQYKEDSIICKDKNKIIERNKDKRNKINKLISTNRVYNGIPYRVFFMSKDLEHVLHNLLNVDRFEKVELSEKFEDTYAEDIEGFYQFITSKDITSGKSYKESWEYLFSIDDKIPRLTNLDIFIKEYYEE